ncbi:translation initiation factor IF-2-like isoform X2 [Vidua macroura]|uniref:translation initiation factor IF-2-like isoform X2 n=1 Tax=Vidua macroura TaxID=187451 RepID=UPI0023A87524|nr:translation initiation factor IF-2-like isoform X2 [Vidua macroura]
MEAEGFAPCHAPALQTKVFRYRLWDVNQRSLYLRGDQLVAGHLQGANAALEGDAGTRAGTRAATRAATRAEGPRVTRREGVLGAQPRPGARPAAGDPGHPARLPLPAHRARPRRRAAAAAAGRGHPGAAPRRGQRGRLHLLPLLPGRAVALRVGRAPRLVPVHGPARPPAPGALSPPRCHLPPARLLLPALLSAPRPRAATAEPRVVASASGGWHLTQGGGIFLGRVA